MKETVIDLINTDIKEYNKVIDGEELVINFYNSNLGDININIEQKNNSKLVINFVSLVSKSVNCHINSLITGDNNKCIINVRTIAEKEISTFDVVVKANKDTQNNKIVEDLKGINEGGSVTLLPILEIDTNDVDASHFATVGSFDKDIVFYLESKGLSYDTVYGMLKKCFLHNIYSSDFISKIEGK